MSFIQNLSALPILAMNVGEIPKLLLYSIIGITFICGGIHYKKQTLLNKISSINSDPNFNSNALEVVMQPKWLNFSTYFIFLLYIASFISLFILFKWWSILLVIVLTTLSNKFFRYIPLPSNKSLTGLYLKTVTKRIDEISKYSFSERSHLFRAKELLDKAWEIANS